MSPSGNDRPPRWVMAFFRWFCRPEFREDIEGDLLERFYNRVTILGTRKAKWLFTKDVLLLFRPGIISNLKSQTQHKFFNMKRISWMKLVAINVLFIIVIILPFLPGPPNKLVIGLSVLAQSAGFFGLLLVPIGITWILLDIRKLGKKNKKIPSWSPFFYLAITAITIITGIYLLLVTGVYLHSGLLTGLLVLLPGAFGLYLAIGAIKKLKNNADTKLSQVSFYLLTIPLIALSTNTFLVRPVSDYSRSYAIQRSQLLITSIEDYKKKEGHYPESIQDLDSRYLKKIPSPFVMGILNFRYNKINNYYSVSFSQWLEFGSLEEIVLYDKNNLKNNLTGAFARYDYKFDLCRVRGAFASHDTRHEHWRYYHVD